MANNVRDLRRRIKSVKSTQQITRAMKLVAASKLRRAQENMQAARPYAAGGRALMKRLAGRMGSATHPLMERRGGGRLLLVVITSDRGLAGSFNANVIRGAVKFLQANPERDVTLELIGRKGRDFFRKRPWPIRGSRVDVFKKLDFDASAAIAADLTKAFLEEAFDEVVLLSNRFKTVMTQDLTFETLLPVGGAEAEAGELDYITEPDPARLLEAIVPRVVETLVHQALMESDASEHGARMVAMENATRNAGEMIERLTLQMNRTRQAAITTEIIEIVSGAAALGGH
jgi:F-type H+-transporting ATPase subunit gamma